MIMIFLYNKHDSVIDAGAHFTEGIWADDPIVLKIIIAGMMILMVQSASKFCTCQNSWAVVLYASLWSHRIIVCLFFK